MRAPLALATVAALSLGIAASVQAQTAPGGDCPEEPAGVVERLASAVRDVLGAANLPARRFRAGLTNCPPGTGFRPLSSVHPAKEVFVGSFPDPRFADYAKAMADAIGRVAPDVKVNLLVHPAASTSTSFVGNPSLFDFARSEPYASRMRVIAATGDPRGGQWAQDGFEHGVTGAASQPAAMELYRGAGAAAASRSGALTTIAGEGQGGDLEAFPGGVVVTGSRIGESTRGILATGAGEAPLSIDTSWLRVGHVDELFQVVPTNGTEPCGFAIVHASPAAALELADRLPATAPLEPTGPAAGAETHGTREPSGTGSCLENLPANAWGGAPLTAGAARACPEFAAANREYDAKIQASLSKIRDAVAAKTGCAEPPTIAVPQLFRPGGVGGLGAGVEPVNPNAVNTLVLGRAVIAGDQPNALFRDEIRLRYETKGVRVEWVDATMFHFNGGGVHCSTNAIRTCD